ncbi:MAG: hypothetical protein ACK52S_07190, partial [Pirellula sp.]
RKPLHDKGLSCHDGATLEPLSSTAHRQEPKTIETIVLPLGSKAFPSRLRALLRVTTFSTFVFENSASRCAARE